MSEAHFLQEQLIIIIIILIMSSRQSGKRTTTTAASAAALGLEFTAWVVVKGLLFEVAASGAAAGARRFKDALEHDKAHIVSFACDAHEEDDCCQLGARQF